MANNIIAPEVLLAFVKMYAEVVYKGKNILGSLTIKFADEYISFGDTTAKMFGLVEVSMARENEGITVADAVKVARFW